MKIIVDSGKLIRRAQFANTASVGGLLLILASVLVPLFLPLDANVTFVFLLVGIVIAMLGIYYANRWVRRPRPEEILNQALKPLTDKYVLYHYPKLPVDHILLTPGCIIPLETVGLAGAFSYHDKRWKENMTFGRAIRSIVEERLGDPTGSAMAFRDYLRNELKEKLDVDVPVKPVVVFTHPATIIEVDSPPIPVFKADKLRKHLPIDTTPLPPEAYEKVAHYLENVTGGSSRKSEPLDQ